MAFISILIDLKDFSWHVIPGHCKFMTCPIHHSKDITVIFTVVSLVFEMEAAWHLKV